LRLRIPQWSAETSATVNGAAVGGLRPGTWAVIERRWTPGDSVRLRLDLRARVLGASDGDKRYAAIVRGPVALSRDLRLAPGSLDEPVSLHPDERGVIPLREMAPPAGVETAFATPGGLALCDYASAGNTWDQRSRFRTWLPA